MTKTIADGIKKGCDKDTKMGGGSRVTIYTCGYNNWYCRRCKDKAQGALEAMENHSEDLKYILYFTSKDLEKQIENKIDELESEIKKLKEILK